MTRRRIGAHGEICKRVNGKMMMTVRLTPQVYEAGDIAMLIGYRMGAIESEGYSNENTALSVLDAIRDWERGNRRLTQKMATSWLSEMYWAVANYTEWTDILPRFDETNEGHLVMLRYIEQIFPKFSTGVIE
tara:strand:+ start:529 stop:924 length:396 start_codon:yes stop_codon:yes gene_type:complete